MFPSNILEFRCLSSFSLGISLISCNGSLCHIKVCFVNLCLFRLFLLTAGMPSKGSSIYPKLLCPCTGYFGAASRLAFPLFYIRFHLIGAFSVVLFVLSAPVQKASF